MVTLSRLSITNEREMAADPHKSLGLSQTYTSLYTAFLKSFIYDDIAFENNATELTLGTILNEHQPTVYQNLAEESADVNAPYKRIFREDEILVYGMPERRQLPPGATQLLREEVEATLRTFAELFYIQEDATSYPPISRLPEDLQGQVDGINSMQLEVDTRLLRLKELLSKTNTTREEFDLELEQLASRTFPKFKASRNASIDLLAATLEATLQKLNTVREHTRQAFYNHQPNEQNPTESVSGAISTAYEALVKEEAGLKMETQDLDRQIQEYEALLRLVDGSGSGYEQVVKDWVKVKRETDECLKDLRRLGWTGD